MNTQPESNAFPSLMTFMETEGRSCAIAINISALAGLFLNFTWMAEPEIMEGTVKIGSTALLVVALGYLLCRVVAHFDLLPMPEEMTSNAENQVAQNPNILKVFQALGVLGAMVVTFGWCLAVFLAWDPAGGIRMTSPNMVSLSVFGILCSSTLLIGSLFGFRSRNGNDTFAAAVFFLLLAPGGAVGVWFLVSVAINPGATPLFSHWVSG